MTQIYEVSRNLQNLLSFGLACWHLAIATTSYLYIIHAKWFVSITEFLAGRLLEMWRCYVADLQCQTPICLLLLFLSKRLAPQRTHATFQDGGPQKISWSKQIAWREQKFHDQNKSLGVNYIQRIIKFELLMLIYVQENSYLRLILLRDIRGSL